MPIVRIEMLQGRSSEDKRRLIREVSEAVSRSLSLEPDRVRVLLYELPPEHWAVGGEPLGRQTTGSTARDGGAR